MDLQRQSLVVLQNGSPTGLATRFSGGSTGVVLRWTYQNGSQMNQHTRTCSIFPVDLPEWFTDGPTKMVSPVNLPKRSLTVLQMSSTCRSTIELLMDLNFWADVPSMRRTRMISTTVVEELSSVMAREAADTLVLTAGSPFLGGGRRHTRDTRRPWRL